VVEIGAQRDVRLRGVDPHAGEEVKPMETADDVDFLGEGLD
jgi:hypothetical protein